MDILELVKETGLEPRRKAACHGGEYCSPCPFCKDGDDRFLVWPQRHNKNGEYQGGRFSCRGPCGQYGDAITFLRLLHGLSYREACSHLKIGPKAKSTSPLLRHAPKPTVADEPPDLWKEKAQAFAHWAHEQLNGKSDGMTLLKNRGFTNESIARFLLGFNPQTLFRERADWGLAQQLKEDGKPRKLWLPAGIVIPTVSAGRVIKVKVRRSEWNEGDKWPKYVEISGSKQMLSIYGDKTLPVALVQESELDSLLVQQEGGDLLYCIAIGGSTKPIDAQTYQLLKKTPLILFLPDFDEAGGVAWVKWKKMFPQAHLVVTPCGKAAGDAFLAGVDLREWLINKIKENQRTLK